MKLERFIKFIEEMKIVNVLHEDANKNGVISYIDYDSKMVGIKRPNLSNSVVKIETFLNSYYLQSSLFAGNYARLPNSVLFEKGMQIVYATNMRDTQNSNGYFGTKGNIITVTEIGMRIKWETGRINDYRLDDDWARNNFLVKIETPEEVRLAKIVDKIKERVEKAREEDNRRTYHVLVLDSSIKVVAQTIKASSAVDARTQVLPILKKLEGYELVIKVD